MGINIADMDEQEVVEFLLGERLLPFTKGDRVRVVGGPYMGRDASAGGTGTVVEILGTTSTHEMRIVVELDVRYGSANPQRLGYDVDEIEKL